MLGAGRERTRKTEALCAAEWNARVPLGKPTSQRPDRKTALVALEMNRHNEGLAVLSETRLLGHDSLEDHGKSTQERKEAGVGFAVRKEMAAMLYEELVP